jgi:putative transposase
MLADRENTDQARLLIAESCDKQGIRAGQLTIHSDRGAVMQSKGLAQLLADLGITKTNSRPHVSNDNPFSESQFKTMKYRPQFPQRFGSQTDGRDFCRFFFDWYNREHYHSAMAYLTPETVHYGRASEVLSSRQRLLIGLHRQPEQVHRRTTSGHPTARGRLDQSTKRRFNDRAAVSVNSPGRLSQNA